MSSPFNLWLRKCRTLVIFQCFTLYNNDSTSYLIISLCHVVEEKFLRFPFVIFDNINDIKLQMDRLTSCDFSVYSLSIIIWSPYTWNMSHIRWSIKLFQVKPTPSVTVIYISVHAGTFSNVLALFNCHLCLFPSGRLAVRDGKSEFVFIYYTEIKIIFFVFHSTGALIEYVIQHDWR